MALKKTWLMIFSLTALFSSAVLVFELWRWDQTRRYNAALESNNFAQAKSYRQDYGLFAKAYAEQQAGQYQAARIIYTSLGKTDDRALRLAALFNLANSYLQQAVKLDLQKQSEQAIPLIELAKHSYRQLLASDSQYWDAKYNLERALQFLPDTGQRFFINRTSSRRLQQKEISSDIKAGLP